MFILRSLFWIFVLGFVFTGGQMATTEGPPSAEVLAASPLAETPAQETALQVMAAADRLSTLCTDQPLVCSVGQEAGRLALDFAAYGSGRLHTLLSDMSAPSADETEGAVR